MEREGRRRWREKDVMVGRGGKNGTAPQCEELLFAHSYKNTLAIVCIGNSFLAFSSFLFHACISLHLLKNESSYFQSSIFRMDVFTCSCVSIWMEKNY